MFHFIYKFQAWWPGCRCDVAWKTWSTWTQTCPGWSGCDTRCATCSPTVTCFKMAVNESCWWISREVHWACFKNIRHASWCSFVPVERRCVTLQKETGTYQVFGPFLSYFGWFLLEIYDWMEMKMNWWLKRSAVFSIYKCVFIIWTRTVDNNY